METIFIIVSNILFITSLVIRNISILYIFLIYVFSFVITTFMTINTLSKLKSPINANDIDEIICNIPKNLLIFCITIGVIVLIN